MIHVSLWTLSQPKIPSLRVSLNIPIFTWVKWNSLRVEKQRLHKNTLNANSVVQSEHEQQALPICADLNT
ncbi:hypothetical protein HanRHA438_Chr11g0530281 [Helianthus annuus]|nr:hypothetical protein HanIR_Chr11g0557951 [Helianthus annuus]KAJ0519519.1 hypothetical protein HanHA89_Chr11g0449601 [Helianthus annuus]KAJ0687513.1 hypothetical protein HanLR1_Chr11g0426871 [Helianthus annuus]KAJ0873018.1 hypothetical protein HanRHA438_Chr11g0530281 [Helianthus annuus]